MSFLLLWSLRILATILVGGLILLGLRRRSAAVRGLALRITLVAAWLLPIAVYFAPRIEITMPRAVQPVSTPFAMLPATTRPPAPKTITALAAIPTAELSPLVAHEAPSPPIDPVPWVYALGVVILTARWLSGYVRLRRLVRQGETISPGVMRVPGLGVPATFGFCRSAVLLPIESAEWPEARLRAAVLHEEAHIRRKDWGWQTLAGLLTALHWFNPAAWLLSRALRDAAEAATDDEVLMSGFSPSAYARELLAVAETARYAGPALALAMARRGGVRDRVVAVLLTSRDRRRPTRLSGSLLLVAVLAAGIGIAGLSEARAKRTPSSITLKNGVTVSIDRLHSNELGSWTVDGTPVAGKPGDSGMKSQGIDMTVSVTGFKKSDDPYVVLLKPYLEDFYKTDSRLFSDGPTSFDCKWNVAGDAPTLTARLAIGSGPWHRYRDSEPEFHVLPERSGKLLDMPIRTVLTVSVPEALRGKNLRISALDRHGRVLKRESETYPGTLHGTATVEADFVDVDPKQFGSVSFDYRDFEIAEFPEIAARPHASASSSEHSIRLVGLGIPGERGWTPAGRPDPNLRPPSTHAVTRRGWRRISVGFLIQGNAFADPTARVTAWGKYAYPSDDFVIQTVPGKPDERLAWCSLQIRPDVAISTLGIDVNAEQWQTDADTTPGDDASHAQLVRDRDVQVSGKLMNLYEVKFPSVAPQSRNRLTELTVFGGPGSHTYLGSVSARSNGTYLIAVVDGQKVGRLLLRSRSIDHVKVEGVHLFPGDSMRVAQAVLADGRTAR